MIDKITDLKNQTKSPEVKLLCETAISAFSANIYNNVSSDAQHEIENITLNNLFEGLSNIEDTDIKLWVSNEKRAYNVKNIGIRESINSLKSESNENAGLKEILEDFKGFLETTPEVLLYENFINALNSFNYFPAIEKSISIITEKVDLYKNDININKIMEAMKSTKSGYLVPLIEDIVDGYLNNKTEETKHFLKEALVKYSYDPYIQDIMNILISDATSLQLEYANATCEIEKIHSPLIYLGENEAVFNIKGSYYIKKGNNINRFPKKDIEKLDEDFVNLCNILNMSNIEINSKGVHVFGDKNDYAQISESKVMINDHEYSDSEFALSAEESKLAGNQNFFYLVETIRANYKEIAEVDFVKRVYLKENDGFAADVFKLRDNVFIATHDPKIAKTTFFRNVNPIQAKNIMLEHLNFDVSKTFKTILPQEEKINNEINETKKEFSNYIALLEGKISAMSSQTVNEVVTQVLTALNEELSEIKSDYKDYLNTIEEYMRAPEGVITEEITVTIDTGKKKYVVPIPSDSGEEGESDADAENAEAGTSVGDEDMDDTAASEITFDPEQSELLGDNPSIEDDQIDLDSDEVEQEAEDAEEEAEELEAEADEFEEEGDSDLDAEDEDEEAQDFEDEFADEDKPKKKKKKKKKKNEALKKTSFINDSAESDIDESSPKKKNKVFLLKKKK
jgi:hypothetical protein